MSEHTAAPWRLNPHDNLSVLGPDNFTVANCSNSSLNRNAPSERRQKANARLIAAAPDMLTALQKLKWVSIEKDNMEFKCETTCFVVDEIRAAIAKATGGE